MKDLENLPEYRDTMVRLEKLKRKAQDGTDYWMARDIHTVLGYPTWREFENVIERAKAAFTANRVDPSHQIVLTHKLMEVGRGARVRGAEYFLSRPACYLIAINGDPTKPEIAAAQAYFVTRTRESEVRESDAKRIELRDKVAQAFRAVSGAAKEAGVRNHMQAIFHDARSHGLYGMSSREVKRKKGLLESDNLFDRAGPLELSANEFQMNLAADVIVRERIKGEAPVISKNREVAAHVRKTIRDSGATMPENLPLEEPIREVRKRIAKQKKLPPREAS